MSDNQSPPLSAAMKAVLEQAEKARISKNWERACAMYDTFFVKTYEYNTLPDSQTAKVLFHYATCLVEKVRATGDKNYDTSELEAATEYLLTAAKIFEEVSPESDEYVMYIDSLDLLANISLMNNQFKRAAKDLRVAIELAEKSPKCGWRITTSLLFTLGIAYECCEKPKSAMESLNKALGIINDRIAVNPPADELELLNGLKKDIEERHEQMKGDAKEQAENKDIITEEEEDEEEDGDDEEEDEEEDGDEEEEEAEPAAEGQKEGEPEADVKKEDKPSVPELEKDVTKEKEA